MQALHWSEAYQLILLIYNSLKKWEYYNTYAYTRSSKLDTFHNSLVHSSTTYYAFWISTRNTAQVSRGAQIISHYGLFDKNQVHIQFHEQFQVILSLVRSLVCTRLPKCFVLNSMCSRTKYFRSLVQALNG